MIDSTENFRKQEVVKINSEVESMDSDSERKRLEAKYVEVWDTEEFSRDFTVTGFAAPFCIVKRKSDNKKGSIEFQHMPRFYFNFLENYSF